MNNSQGHVHAATSKSNSTANEKQGVQLGETRCKNSQHIECIYVVDVCLFIYYSFSSCGTTCQRHFALAIFRHKRRSVSQRWKMYISQYCWWADNSDVDTFTTLHTESANCAAINIFLTILCRLIIHAALLTN